LKLRYGWPGMTQVADKLICWYWYFVFHTFNNGIYRVVGHYTEQKYRSIVWNWPVLICFLCCSQNFHLPTVWLTDTIIDIYARYVDMLIDILFAFHIFNSMINRVVEHYMF
jgi:hypothetical protein